jgi:ABC-type sugar transport system ATPase subunit
MTAERRNMPIRKRDSNSTIAIRVRNVSKSFPGVQALRGINFELLSGEVHGLVGANGAGKSTFIRMLSGASQPDTGEIEVQGSPLLFEDPRLQRGMGIAAIYQELTIIPEMSVLSNAFIGKVPSRFFFTDKRRMERRFAELSRWMGLNISPHVNAGTLSVANQQMIEILRAVQTDQNVLIMDEPTAPLGPFERARLYDLIGRLKENGVARSRLFPQIKRPGLRDAGRPIGRDPQCFEMDQGHAGSGDARRRPDRRGQEAKPCDR